MHSENLKLLNLINDNSLLKQELIDLYFTDTDTVICNKLDCTWIQFTQRTLIVAFKGALPYEIFPPVETNFTIENKKIFVFNEYTLILTSTDWSRSCGFDHSLLMLKNSNQVHDYKSLETHTNNLDYFVRY